MASGTAKKHGHLFSVGGIVSDHIHLTLGCTWWEESPTETVLCYMNHLAYVAGMKRIFQFGFYTGTFGEYDLGATRP